MLPAAKSFPRPPPRPPPRPTCRDSPDTARVLRAAREARPHVQGKLRYPVQGRQSGLVGHVHWFSKRALVHRTKGCNSGFARRGCAVDGCMFKGLRAGRETDESPKFIRISINSVGWCTRNQITHMLPISGGRVGGCDFLSLFLFCFPHVHCIVLFASLPPPPVSQANIMHESWSQTFIGLRSGMASTSSAASAREEGEDAPNWFILMLSCHSSCRAWLVVLRIHVVPIACHFASCHDIAFGEFMPVPLTTTRARIVCMQLPLIFFTCTHWQRGWRLQVLAGTSFMWRQVCCRGVDMYSSSAARSHVNVRDDRVNVPS